MQSSKGVSDVMNGKVGGYVGLDGEPIGRSGWAARCRRGWPGLSSKLRVRSAKVKRRVEFGRMENLSNDAAF